MLVHNYKLFYCMTLQLLMYREKKKINMPTCTVKERKVILYIALLIINNCSDSAFVSDRL